MAVHSDRGAIAKESSTSAEAAPRLLSWILLSGFFLIADLAQVVYASHGVEPSARFHLVTLIGTWLLLWYWFAQQLAPYDPKWPMDMGAFIIALWFVLMPYYFWRYERWRGLLKLIALGLIYVLAWVFSGVMYVALG
ncbi:MAG TPA: hypothetical protein VKI41_12980 [Vicinamibacteria bacterium]|nr:hypothetical protein [Vicinamibacteria bacterium]